MKKHLFPIILLVCMILSACQNQCPPLTNQQKTDIGKQVLELWDRIIPNSLMNLDSNGYSQFLISDEFLGHYVEGGVIPSKDGVIDSINVWFNFRVSQIKQNKTVKTYVLAKDLVLIDQFGVFQIDNKNGETWRGKHAISVLFKKENSGWKVIHSHESGGDWKQVTEIK
jgi:hypothetical protein